MQLRLTDQQIEEARDDLPYVSQVVYVDNAAVSPVPKRVQAAMNQHTEYVVQDPREATALSIPIFDLGRARAAKLVGSKPDRIAYVQNTSHGLSLVALGLDWREGDNLVIPAHEFPSNYLCWLQLAAQGVEVRKIDAVGGRLRPEDLQVLVDDRTRLVAVSHVQFYSGFRVDLPQFGEICSKHNALLVVDGTQSIGALALDVLAANVDVLVVSGHKWMLAPRGIGFISISDRAFEQITPKVLGWLSVNEPFAFNRTLDVLPDARRFEAGTPNGAGIFGLVERLRQIDELGPASIEQRVLDLNQLLIDRCDEADLEVAFRFERNARSGILLVRKAGVPSDVLLGALSSERIYASIRNGAVRLSPHYYNTSSEIEQIVTILAKAGP